MTRTVNEKRPQALLDAIVGYLVKHGIADLSLRPLANGVGSSPRVLLYYFGSKEKMLAKALARVRENQRTMFSRLYAAKGDSRREAYFAIWKHMSAPESQPMFRLFFETFGLALRNPKRFQLFLRTTLEDWLEFVADSDLQKQLGPADARAFATIVLAGFRGFLLDYSASRDRQRLDRAVRLWISSLDSIALPQQEVGQ